MAREILSKRNFFDFESPDSAISPFPMTLMKSMASLHQGPKFLNCTNCFIFNVNNLLSTFLVTIFFCLNAY
ncbi:unnamed protein product [Tenebrio molitor]|nr:unnamed protein product [Tenebrio molitor]